MKTNTVVHRTGREEITLRLGDDEPRHEERPSPQKVRIAPAPEREPDTPEAEAAEALDRIAFPGAALNILRAAAQAEAAWRAWSETERPAATWREASARPTGLPDASLPDAATWPLDRSPTLQEIPALCYATPPDFEGFVASCPREVIPFLAGAFYIAVEEARAVRPSLDGFFFEESRRPLRESLAAIVGKVKQGTPHSRRASRIFRQVQSGRPPEEVAEMFGVSIQTIRSTVSAERRRRGLPPLRKRER